mmetsp:Transcript_17162/g.28418  ORF Transcript_17162/g.28418 Transcript_17162/m.28418 type:complete len:197 (+) Transcript_17162:150-740(+)
MVLLLSSLLPLPSPFLVVEGISGKDIASKIPGWERKDLHQLVAHFLRIRFPLLLALNKADTKGAEERAQKVRNAHPGEIVVEISARAEWKIRKNVRKGRLKPHLRGATTPPKLAAKFLTEGKGAKLERWASKLQPMFSRISGTGVHSAITQAVEMANPVLIYPVVDLTTCFSSTISSSSTTTTSTSSTDIVIILNI